MNHTQEFKNHIQDYNKSEKPRRLQFMDKYGYPVERVKGRWFQNFRLLIHTHKVKWNEE